MKPLVQIPSSRQSPFLNLDCCGAVLIISIWLSVILSVFAIGVARTASSGLRFQGHIYDELRARYLIKAVLNKLALEFQNDPSPDYDSLNEYNLHDDKIDFGDGMSVTYKITDEERKLNINTAAKETLGRLDGFSQELASAVVDWRDPDSLPLPDGAEDLYYAGVKPYHYECKDSNFEVIEELLLVKDMTKDTFYGVMDTITIFGDGRININTADKKVLSVVGMSEGLIDRITLFRSGDDDIEGTEDDNIFKNPATIPTELERVTGALELSMRTELAQLQNLLAVKSNFLTVVTSAKVFDKEKANSTAVIERSSGKVLYYRQK